MRQAEGVSGLRCAAADRSSREGNRQEPLLAPAHLAEPWRRAPSAVRRSSRHPCLRRAAQEHAWKAQERF